MQTATLSSLDTIISAAAAAAIVVVVISVSQSLATFFLYTLIIFCSFLNT